MQTPLPTLVSAAGNLALEISRPRQRPAAPEASFSRTLSQKRRSEPEIELRESNPAPVVDTPARTSDPDRRAAAPDDGARNAEPPAKPADQAQAAAQDAQNSHGQAASGADDGRPTGAGAAGNSQISATADQAVSQAAAEAVAAQQAVAGIALDAGLEGSGQNQSANVSTLRCRPARSMLRSRRRPSPTPRPTPAASIPGRKVGPARVPRPTAGNRSRRATASSRARVSRARPSRARPATRPRVEPRRSRRR
jgi:hypothetical protein